jgi:hypothetical protein
MMVRTNTFALSNGGSSVSEGVEIVVVVMRRGIAHRGVFAAEAEVVKRRRKEAIDSEGTGRGKMSL